MCYFKSPVCFLFDVIVVNDDNEEMCVCVCGRFLQKNCAEQEGVFMCRQSAVSHRQESKEKMSVLQISEMSQCWYEVRRCV